MESVNQTATSERWYALRVKPQHEKSVTLALDWKSYQSFLPLYTVTRHWGRTKRIVHLPLFAGYTFCCFPASNRLPVLTIPGVKGVVSVGREPAVIQEEELDAVRAILGSGLPTKPHPFLKVGSVVRLRDGPLKGLQGVLTKFKGVSRLVVSVCILQRSVCVEIDQDWVTPCNL